MPSRGAYISISTRFMGSDWVEAPPPRYPLSDPVSLVLSSLRIPLVIAFVSSANFPPRALSNLHLPLRMIIQHGGRIVPEAGLYVFCLGVTSISKRYIQI